MSANWSVKPLLNKEAKAEGESPASGTRPFLPPSYIYIRGVVRTKSTRQYIFNMIQTREFEKKPETIGGSYSLAGSFFG
jgi:hypothetical protein